MAPAEAAPKAPAPSTSVTMAALAPKRRAPPPEFLSPKRRAPALERLPRWLFAPARLFVSRGRFPLPRRVSASGTPFYDWDAWAVALLHADLWTRRGPWERLVASCAAARPGVVSRKAVGDVKSALVRIVVAEVVGLLVMRSAEQLTSEDRNWITSVASRQRGRYAGKPTLMLLFDLAFSTYDLYDFCRIHSDPALWSVAAQMPAAPQVDQAMHAVLEGASRRARAPPAPDGNVRTAETTDPVVVSVLRMIAMLGAAACSGGTQLEHPTLVNVVQSVINSIDRHLSRALWPRWYQELPTAPTGANNCLFRAAQAFCRRVPLTLPAKRRLSLNRFVAKWLSASLAPNVWQHWAELANDCNYALAAGSSTASADKELRENLCRIIVTTLLNNATSASIDPADVEQIASAEIAYAETRLTVRRIVDMALGLEHFTSFVVVSHFTQATDSVCWGAMCFESLVQQLSGTRDVLVMGPGRELAMVQWSARCLAIARYYRDAIQGPSDLREDVERAVHCAFAEASWVQSTRALRFMVQPPPPPRRQQSLPPRSPQSPGSGRFVKSDARAASPPSVRPTETPQTPVLWLTTLDTSDPLILAALIVQWDPQRALKLLDEAIWLGPEELNSIRMGKEGLTLWDSRRIAVCRALSCRMNPQQTALIMQRLHIIFDLKHLHVGGNFSEETVRLLEAATWEGNFCAQTTHGLLLAGESEYWEVARRWADCEKSTAEGIKKLYTSVVAGDLEAAIALSHLWAQGGVEGNEVFDGISMDEVHAVFKIAVTTQNANAVLNLGVMWRYGAPCLTPSVPIAIDAFLIALQGGLSSDARAVSAKHLSETVVEGRPKVVEILSKLITSFGEDSAPSSSSPHRIDDFCGTGTAKQVARPLLPRGA